MKSAILVILLFLSTVMNQCFAQSENIYRNSIGACLSIYGIYYDSYGKPESYSTGTGFFIDRNEGLFCTAFHVVQGASEVVIDYGYDSETIPNDYINPTRIYPLDRRSKYYWIDESRDLIVFKIPELKPFHDLQLSNTLPSAGSSIHTIGNTFGEYTMKFSSGQIGQIRQTNLMKWIISEFTGLGGGNSGGPVFDDYGNVVGIVDQQDNRNNTIIWIIPSMYVTYLLEDASIRGNDPSLSKEFEDFVLTPDIYSNLKPYGELKISPK